MAITIDNIVSSITAGFQSGPQAFTWSHTTTNTNPVFVFIADIWQDTGPTGTVTSATYGGVALTKIEGTTSVSMASELWYLKAPPTGANVFRTTVTGATDAVKMATASFINVDQTAPLDEHTSITGTTGNPAITLTTITDNDVVVSTLSRFSTTAASTDKTSIYNDATGSILGAASYNVTTTHGAQTDTYTGTVAQDWSMVAAAFKPSGGAPPAVTYQPRRMKMGMGM